MREPRLESIAVTPINLVQWGVWEAKRGSGEKQVIKKYAHHHHHHSHPLKQSLKIPFAFTPVLPLEEISKAKLHIPNSFSIMLAGSFGKAHRSNNLCRGQHPAASPDWALYEAGRESFCLAVSMLRVIFIAVHEDIWGKWGKGSVPITCDHPDWLLQEPLTSITSSLNWQSNTRQLTETLAARVNWCY